MGWTTWWMRFLPLLSTKVGEGDLVKKYWETLIPMLTGNGGCCQEEIHKGDHISKLMYDVRLGSLDQMTQELTIFGTGVKCDKCRAKGNTIVAKENLEIW